MTLIGTTAAALMAQNAVPPVAGYAAYKLLITANNGESYARVQEFYGYLTVGGSDVLNQGGANATFSSISNFGGFGPEKAFSHEQGWDKQAWVNNSGGSNQWIKATLTSPGEVTRLCIQSMVSEATRAPKDFKLEYSDDNLSWTSALTVTNETGWSTNTPRLWDVPSAGAHTYWRLYIDVNNGDGYCSLGDLGFFLSDGTIVTDSNGRGAITVSDAYSGALGSANTLLRASHSEWADKGSRPSQIIFITSQPLVQFGIKGTSTTTSSPRDFELLGSNDLSTWTSLGSWTSQTGWASGETRKYTI